MLSRLARRALLCGTLLLAACEASRDGLEEPQAIEASYRLLFNEVLVGKALFELHIDSERRYRLEAFTVPAGQMQRAAGHEVLESSRGVIAADAIRPLRFDHSVLEGEHIEVMKLLFDWDRRTLQLHGRDGARDIVLPPGTYDRLSYLLAARRLAAQGHGAMQIQVATPDGSEEGLLEVVGRTPIEVPLGHYQAVAVQRVGPDAGENRVLWFDPTFAPLPLRVVHVHDGSTVDMQLEGLNRRPSGPR